jgi:hypothetical protein
MMSESGPGAGQCQGNLHLSAWKQLRNVPDMLTHPFRYFKTSPEIIRLAVMLCVRFPYRSAMLRIYSTNAGST